LLVSDAMVIDGDGTIKFRCGAVLSFLFSWRILLVPCVMPQLRPPPSVVYSLGCTRSIGFVDRADF
jgi:hypothetical protein